MTGPIRQAMRSIEGVRPLRRGAAPRVPNPDAEVRNGQQLEAMYLEVFKQMAADVIMHGQAELGTSGWPSSSWGCEDGVLAEIRGKDAYVQGVGEIGEINTTVRNFTVDSLARALLETSGWTANFHKDVEDFKHKYSDGDWHWLKQRDFTCRYTTSKRAVRASIVD